MIIREEIDRVFRDELGLEPPAPEVDLIASGLLDSLAIVSLLVEVEHRFGIRIPLETLDLDAMRTVERLETLITSGGVRTTESPAPVESGSVRDPATLPALLVLLRAGEGRPVYIIHTALGGANTARGIAEVLDTQRPIYALQALGYDSAAEPHRAIEEMAAAYVEAIKSIQPSGPYSLGGYSFGGLVAYEMACQLRAGGEDVDTLAMVDSHAPAVALPTLRRWRFGLGRPIRYTRYILESPRIRIPLYLRKLTVRLRPPQAARPQDRLVLPRVAELKAIAEAAEDAYRPQPYYGDALLLLAETRDPSKCNPREMWTRKVGGRLEVIAVGGDHSDLLRHNLPRVGTEISRWLSRT